MAPKLLESNICFTLRNMSPFFGLTNFFSLWRVGLSHPYESFFVVQITYYLQFDVRIIMPPLLRSSRQQQKNKYGYLGGFPLLFEGTGSVPVYVIFSVHFFQIGCFSIMQCLLFLSLPYYPLFNFIMSVGRLCCTIHMNPSC